MRGWIGQDFFQVVGRIKLPGKRTESCEREITCTRVQNNLVTWNFTKWFMMSHRHALESWTFFKKKIETGKWKNTPRISRYINFQCYFVISSLYRGFDSDLPNICCWLLRTRQSVWRAQCEEEGKAIHEISSTASQPVFRRPASFGRAMAGRAKHAFSTQLYLWTLQMRQAAREQRPTNSPAHFLLQGIK